MTTQLPKEKFNICKTSNTFAIERVLQSNIDWQLIKEFFSDLEN